MKIINRLLAPIYIFILILFRRFSKAQIFCKKELQKSPNDSLILNLLAYSYKKEGNFSLAAQEYLKLLEKDPKEPSNYRDAIRTLYEAKDYELAIKYGIEFLNKQFIGLRQRYKSSFNEEIYWYLSFSYYFLQNHNEAKKYFEKISPIKKWQREYNISKYIDECKKALSE